MINILRGTMIGLAMIVSGCATTLAEINSAEPLRTGTFKAPFKTLAACAKEQAQIEEWNPETAIIESINSTGRIRLVSSIYAAFSRIVLFEVTLVPVGGGTFVEYRDGWRARLMRDQAWSIIEQCGTTSPIRAFVDPASPGVDPE